MPEMLGEGNCEKTGWKLKNPLLLARVAYQFDGDGT